MNLHRIHVTLVVLLLAPFLRSERAIGAATDLSFATYLGGDSSPTGEDTIRDVAIDVNGYIYITGGTANSDFPVTGGAYDTSFNDPANNIQHDIFVAKLAPDGALLWATFLGGPAYDRAYAIEVDISGFVYVAGRAGVSFPTTAGVVQPSFAGDNDPNSRYGPQDGFIAKFSNDGSQLVWSTYLGGAGPGFLRDMDVDDQGQVYVTISEDANSPWVTPGAFQTVRRGGTDAIVGKLKADASALEWCSYVSGSAKEFGTPSIRVDDQGYVYILGGTASDDLPTTAASFQPGFRGTTWDLALFKFLPDGSDIVYGAYIGGTGNEFTETHGLLVDAQGRAHVAATTTSSNLPTTIGAYQDFYAGGANGRGNYPGDGFVSVISADGSVIEYSTYFGGRDGEGIEGISFGANGTIVIGGSTYSQDLPVTNDAFQATNWGGADQFVAVLSTDLSTLKYASYLGATGRSDFGRALTADRLGNVVVAGQTDSYDFPVVNAVQATNAGGSFDAVVSMIAVPEPSQTALSTSGIAVLALLRKRRSIAERRHAAAERSEVRSAGRAG